MQNANDRQGAAELFSEWDSSDSTSAERAAVDELGRVPWAGKLLTNLKAAESTGDRRQQRAYRWEARIALSIHRLGYEAQYEYKAGEHEQSIDFRVASRPELLIEAVAIQNSRSSEEAGWVAEMPGVAIFGLTLNSANPDQRQTTAGEMIRAVELLAGKAAKFPIARTGTYQLIAADIRGYNAGRIDLDDCDQIAFGPAAVQHDAANRQLFLGTPVRGVFDRGNSRPIALQCQRRIHGIGLFGGRNIGSPDVLSTRVSIYKANPWLITQRESDLVARLLDGGSTGESAS